MATVFTRNPTHDSFAVVRTSSAQDPTLSLGLRGINTQLGVHKQGSRGGESRFYRLQVGPRKSGRRLA